MYLLKLPESYVEGNFFSSLCQKKEKEKKKRNASNGEWHSLAGFTAVIDSCVSSCYLSVWSSVGRQLTEHCQLQKLTSVAINILLA